MPLKKLIYNYLADEYLAPVDTEAAVAQDLPHAANEPKTQITPNDTANSTPVKTSAAPLPENTELLNLYYEILQNLKYPLVESAKNMVFGCGKIGASIMVIGEAPGADEDEQGLPFVGRAGRYMMEVFKNLGVQREELYLANILKHRPPNNRDPQPLEVQLCTPYLVRQIAIVQPKLLVTVGNFASKFILQTETGITKLRGAIHESTYGKVYPTLHPSAIIRGAYPKELFEGDIAKALSITNAL